MRGSRVLGSLLAVRGMHSRFAEGITVSCIDVDANVYINLPRQAIRPRADGWTRWCSVFCTQQCPRVELLDSFLWEIVKL